MGASLMKLSELEQKKLPFRGSELNIKVVRSPFSFSRITQKENLLTINLSSIFKTEEEQVKEAGNQIMLWYKSQARRYFTQEVQSEKAKYGFSYKEIAIKDTASRWGSCSAQKNLNFNWRLIMTPPEILRYVVCHEIAHLTHLNHSTDFWNLVEKMYPKYKEAKQWLHDNCNEILSFSL